MESKKIIHLKIEETSSQKRLDKVLAELVPSVSRTQISKLISQQKVTLQGKPIKSSYIAKIGDEIQMELPEKESLILKPYEYPLDIIYEDEHLIVINKPSGLVVHPAPGHRQDTLVNALIFLNQTLSKGSNRERPGIVHRLDKETSGLLLVAKNDFTHSQLGKQFMRRKIHRIYKAIVFGNLKEKNGKIESRIARHPLDRKRFASTQNSFNGKIAITSYKVLATSLTGLSLIELKLETGRTHQIRVHLSEKGHPLVGDTAYGGDKKMKIYKSKQFKEIVTKMNRFALHASELGFEHPLTKKELFFKAPWPSDLEDLIEFCSFDLKDVK